MLPLVLKAVEVTSQRKLWRASFSTIQPEWEVTCNFSNQRINPNHDRGKSTLIRPQVGKYALSTFLVFILLKSTEKLMLCLLPILWFFKYFNVYYWFNRHFSKTNLIMTEGHMKSKIFIETLQKSHDRHKINFSYDFLNKHTCTAEHFWGMVFLCSWPNLPLPVMIKVIFLKPKYNHFNTKD